MKILLLYFGRPGENLNIKREFADIPDSTATLADLLAWLHLRGDNWKHELSDSRIRCSINKEFAAWSAKINERDEVAIFSPISGG